MAQAIPQKSQISKKWLPLRERPVYPQTMGNLEEGLIARDADRETHKFKIPKKPLHLRERLIYFARMWGHELGIAVAILLVPKEKSIMVLMLVLLMMVGCGGILFAPAQTKILDAIVGTGSIVGFSAGITSPNPETISIPPLWSG